MSLLFISDLKMTKSGKLAELYTLIYTVIYFIIY